MANTAFKNEFDLGAPPAPLADDGGAEERVLAKIRELGLEQNIWELDAHGYTVLKPSQVAPPGFADRMREAILNKAAATASLAVDPAHGDSDREALTKVGGSHFPDILYSDPIFEQAMMVEAPLALVTYLVGESCEMSAMNAVIKEPGTEPLPLHADTAQPPPLSRYAHVANATWILSDFNASNGATVFVPGSHKWCRHPVGDETADLSQGVPVEAPAGSVMVWHGNTWHGALPRSAPGVRVSLITYFARFYVKKSVSRQPLPDLVTPEMLARNPERFALLTGQKEVSIPTEFYCRSSQFA